MAIDPSIVLGYQPVQGPNFQNVAQTMGALTNMQVGQQQIQNLQQNILTQQQEIAASKTAQAATEAQIPGMEAQSKLTQRKADYNQWLTDNSPTYTNDDGSPNTVGLMNAARKAGFQDEASASTQAILNNAGTAIVNAGNQQDQGIAKMNFVTTLLGHTATELDALSKDPAAQVSLLHQRAEWANGIMPGAGDQLIKSFSTTPSTNAVTGGGQAITASDGSVATTPTVPGQVQPLTIDKAKVAGVAKATMTPLQAGDLAVSQQNANTAALNAYQSGVIGMSSPRANDPNSPESVQARAFAQAAGVPVTPQTTAAQLKNLPGLSAAVDASVVSGQVKAAAVADSGQQLQQSSTLNNAAHAVDKLISRGLMMPGDIFSTWIQNNASKYANDPDVQAAKAATAAAGPNFDFNTGAASVSAALKQLSSQAVGKARVAQATVNATTYNAVPTAQTGAAASPARTSASPSRGSAAASHYAAATGSPCSSGRRCQPRLRLPSCPSL